MNGFFGFLILLLLSFPASAMAQGAGEVICGLSLYTVEGNSMAPLIRPGDKVETYPWQCLTRAIADGDVVVFTSAASKTPLIKRVVAVAGDRFAVTAQGVNVNGRAVTTANGRAFALAQNRLAMVALYEKEYKGIIPQESFLVLGEAAGGTTDSTRFGLISKADIKGVMVNNLSEQARKAAAAQ